MRFVRQNTKLSVITLVVVLAGCGLFIASQVQADAHESDDEADNVLVVGTYNPGEVFQASAASKELDDKAQAAQAEANQAQQDGDQEKMMRISQQYQMDQQRIIQQFQQDIEAVMPGVAKSEGVKLVAIEIAYADPDVKAKDVTGAVTKAMAEAAKDSEATTQDSADPQNMIRSGSNE